MNDPNEPAGSHFDALFERARDLTPAEQIEFAERECSSEVERQRLLDLQTQRASVAENLNRLDSSRAAPASIDVAVVSKYPAIDVLRHRDDALPLPGGGIGAACRVTAPVGQGPQ